ncbi:MAG: glycosyltransferase family 4 protein, partial [bacterium]|nr:glycosyltransferase family 4 protein [bacterium]
RVGGNTELVEHRRTGLVFEAGNPEDLAGQLRALIEAPGLRQGLAEAGSAFVRSGFSLESSVRRMEQIYMDFFRNTSSTAV